MAPPTKVFSDPKTGRGGRSLLRVAFAFVAYFAKGLDNIQR